MADAAGGIAIGQNARSKRPNSMPRYRRRAASSLPRAPSEEVTPPAAQDNLPASSQLLNPSRRTARHHRAGAVAAATEPAPVTAAPLFRARQDIPGRCKGAPSGIPPVIPMSGHRMIRGSTRSRQATNSPTDQSGHGQPAGWRGFLSRWGG